MMKFKMNKVATAVAASLGVSVVGMNIAQSDEILFPYVAASSTVTTLISTVNDGDIFTAGELHYRYYFKDGANATSKSAACSEVDFRRVSSPNDVVTFDVSDKFGQATLGVLFEDPADQINVNYQAANQSFSGLRNVTKPVRAFALIDNNDLFNFAPAAVSANLSPSGFAVDGFLNFSDDMSLSGEALVLEFGSGASWGYRAYNAAGIYNTNLGRLNPFDFSDRVETAGEVIASRVDSTDGLIAGGEVPTTLLPFSAEGGEFDTRLFVTPVSSFQLNGALTTQVSFAIDDPDSPLAADVIYDRDENPISGRVPMNVVCVAALDANDMLTAPARGEAPTGGWTNVRVRNTAGGVGVGSTSNNVSEAIVIKLEFNEGTGTINGEPAFSGNFNASFWLRLGIRESLQRPFATYTVLNDDNSPCPLLSDAEAATGPTVCLQ